MMESEKATYLSELPTREVVALFRRIQAQVPGFVAAALVDLHSGMILAAHSARTEFDLLAACAFNSEIVKQEKRGLQAVGSKSILEDMMLTLSDQIHILKMVDAGTAFLYLAADRSSTNLAIARGALDVEV